MVFSNDPCYDLSASLLAYLPYLPTTVAALRVARLTALSGQHELYLMGGTALASQRYLLYLHYLPSQRYLH